MSGTCTRFLAHRFDLLRDELARLRNHREWGVKVCGNGARPDVARSSEEALVSREGKDEVKGRGAAYLHRKEAARRTAAEHRQTRHALLRHAFETLDRIATESISAPPESQRTSGVGEHVLLNASYLVSCAKEAGFVAAVGMLDEELRAAALPLVLTGPWPAYHFVSPHVSAQLSSGYGHE